MISLEFFNIKHLCFFFKIILENYRVSSTYRKQCFYCCIVQVIGKISNRNWRFESTHGYLFISPLNYEVLIYFAQYSAIFFCTPPKATCIRVLPFLRFCATYKRKHLFFIGKYFLDYSLTFFNSHYIFKTACHSIRVNLDKGTCSSNF